MQLLLVGVSHRTAPIELRERLDFSARGVDRALTALAGSGAQHEATIVSTCNRVELYVGCDDPEAARAAIQRFLSEFHGIPGEQLAPHLYAKTGQEAVTHLFRVASGLDSLVMGEPQILGQVKDAFGVASQLGCTGPLLNKLFHSAFAAGKRVRSETALAEGAVSVSYAAVELARKIFGNLKGRTVLVLGAGEMGKLTAIHMQSQGIGRLIITSRTAAHATALAQSIGGSAMPWDSLNTALVEADILITATGASAPIISRALISQTMKTRRQRPLFIIDIAVPRDVEAAPAISSRYSSTTSTTCRRSCRKTSRSAVPKRPTRKRSSRRKSPSSSAGSTRAAPCRRSSRCGSGSNPIRQSELRRLEPKLASLPPEARARVEEITRLILEKLLINPTEQLKSAPDADTVGGIQRCLEPAVRPRRRRDAATRHADRPLAQPEQRRNPHQ